MFTFSPFEQLAIDLLHLFTSNNGQTSIVWFDRARDSDFVEIGFSSVFESAYTVADFCAAVSNTVVLRPLEATGLGIRILDNGALEVFHIRHI